MYTKQEVGNRTSRILLGGQVGRDGDVSSDGFWPSRDKIPSTLEPDVPLQLFILLNFYSFC